jgi:hypothetical protein
MRITANVPDPLGVDAKNFAGNENVSVSSLITKALEFYLTQSRKKKMGFKPLNNLSYNLLKINNLNTFFLVNLEMTISGIYPMGTFSDKSS